ncbi:hypothetical protein [Pacificoceanicola onchidii]|uniref:hypothetical protein n=1 Tax=Pacificoceanicola onchidii TaxID=2562685 RepID=UPI0010A496BE|nr:hypothetical protein [Pacificoceanicola onchidii]
MSKDIDPVNTEETGEIALDHTRLLGYWLLPDDHIEQYGEDRHSIRLKMGNKGGNKFFGGNAGIRKVA